MSDDELEPEEIRQLRKELVELVLDDLRNRPDRPVSITIDGDTLAALLSRWQEAVAPLQQDLSRFGERVGGVETRLSVLSSNLELESLRSGLAEVRDQLRKLSEPRETAPPPTLTVHDRALLQQVRDQLKRLELGLASHTPGPSPAAEEAELDTEPEQEPEVLPPEPPAGESEGGGEPPDGDKARNPFRVFMAGITRPFQKRSDVITPPPPVEPSDGGPPSKGAKKSDLPIRLTFGQWIVLGLVVLIIVLIAAYWSMRPDPEPPSPNSIEMMDNWLIEPAINVANAADAANNADGPTNDSQENEAAPEQNRSDQVNDTAPSNSSRGNR